MYCLDFIHLQKFETEAPISCAVECLAVGW